MVLAPVEDGVTTVVVLPDTQYYYNDQRSGNFGKWLAQMNWIRNEAEAQRIAYVVQLGDVTDQSDHSAIHLAQWRSARQVTSAILDRVPLALTTGNHDGLHDSHTTLFSAPEYFGPGSPYANQPSLVETLADDRMDNSVHLLEIAGREWIILTLEWGPSDAALAWADRMLTRYADRSAIVVTHGYLFRDSSRYDWALLGEGDASRRQSANPLGYGGLQDVPEGANDGQMIWDKVLRKHSNVSLVMSGHVSRSGHGRRVAVGDHGNVVQEHLINFQHWSGDGNGFMRLLRFQPDGETAEVVSFSPFTGEVLDGPDLNFRFSLPNRPLVDSYTEAVAELGAEWHLELSEFSPDQPLLSRIPGRIFPPRQNRQESSADFAPGEILRLPITSTIASEWTLVGWVRSAAHGGFPCVVLRGETPEMQLTLRASVEDWDFVPRAADPLAITVDDATVEIRLRAEQWHHWAVRSDGTEWEIVLDGEAVWQMSAPAWLPLEAILGDPGETMDSSIAWQIDGVSFFHHGLSFADLDWMRRSAFREILVGGQSYPGLVSTIDDGDQLRGTSENAYYRTQETVGASRDPHPNFVRYPRALQYSDGFLLLREGRSPLELARLSEFEGRYFGESYASAWRSVLHSPVEAGDSDTSAIFFPDRGKEWISGYITERGEWRITPARAEATSLDYIVEAGSYRFVPPNGEEGWLLLQSGRSGIRPAARKSDHGWEIAGFRADGSTDYLRTPFSLLWVPDTAGNLVGGEADSPRVTPLDKGVFRIAGGDLRWLVAQPLIDTVLGRPAHLEQTREDSGDWVVRLRSSEDGDPVDADFLWVGEAEPSAASPAESLGDVSVYDESWSYGHRLRWIFTDPSFWPWTWSPQLGWIYPLVPSAAREGLWFYRAVTGRYYYVSAEFPDWLYQHPLGWTVWSAVNG
jgi:hypothetical protein